MQKSESLAVAVPQQLFRAPLYWALYEASRSWLTRSLLFCSLLALSGSFTLQYSFGIPLAVVSLVLLFFLLMSPMWNLLFVRRVVSKNRALLAKVIYEVDPGMDLQKWDEVTYQMNELLYHGGLWRTPYCMFSREFCHMFFRIFLLMPYVNRTFEIQEPCELGDQKNCTEVCVAYYERAVRGEFERLVSIKLPDLLEEYQTLPKKEHLKKSTRTCQSLDKFTKLGFPERLRFLATVIKVKANSNAERLDTVARYMNQYLRSDEVWKDPQEYFFDGKECLSFFQKQLAPLASNKKLKGNVTTYYELKDMVSVVIESLRY